MMFREREMMRARPLSREAAATLASPGRVFYCVFGALLASHAVLMALPRLYPFVDLPNHMAAATIFKYFGEDSNRFDEFYALDTAVQPNLFHIVVPALRVFPSVETGYRVLLCAYALLLPMGAYWLIRTIQGNPWFAMPSFLLLHGFNTGWGFAGFLFSIPFVLLVVTLIPATLEPGRLWPKCILSLTLVLLFSMHALTTVFALLVFATAVAWESWNTRRCRVCLAGALIALPTALMLGVWWFGGGRREGSLVAFLLSYYRSQYGIVERTGILWSENQNLFAGTSGHIAGVCFTSCIAGPVLFLAFQNRETLKAKLKTREGVALASFFVIAVASFGLAPDSIPGQWFLYQRFGVFVFLALLGIGSVAAVRVRTSGMLIFFSVACVLHLALWAQYFYAFQRENETFARAVFPEGSEQTLGGLVYDFEFRGRPTYIHFPNYYIVWNRGVAANRFVDYRFGLVRRKADEYKLPRYNEWIGRTREPFPEHYLDLDYIVVRGSLPPGVAVQGFDFDSSAGNWTRYRRSEVRALQRRSSRRAEPEVGMTNGWDARGMTRTGAGSNEAPAQPPPGGPRRVRP
jgi:hypothetical protein